MTTAKLTLGEREFELPVTTGSENETAIDISKLRAASGAITLDSGYGNTGSCKSAITFIDGEKGILRYRGYPDRRARGEERRSWRSPGSCSTASYRTQAQLEEDYTRAEVTRHTMLHEDMKKFFEGYPPKTRTRWPSCSFHVRPRPVDLLPGDRGGPKGTVTSEHRAPAGQGADHRGLLLQEVHRPADRLPAQRSLVLLRELPQHDVRGAVEP